MSKIRHLERASDPTPESILGRKKAIQAALTIGRLSPTLSPVFLFGSAARGVSTPSSDVDLLCVSGIHFATNLAQDSFQSNIISALKDERYEPGFGPGQIDITCTSEDVLKAIGNPMKLKTLVRENSPGVLKQIMSEAEEIWRR